MESIKVEDLLESSIFQCKHCSKRLSPPIMDVKDIGNICGRCYHRNSYTNAKENIDITGILMKLYLSCNNRKQGCTFQGSYAETIAHEEECSYREKICPFTYLNRCNYHIPFSSVPRHIKKEHLNDVSHYVSNLIKTEIAIEGEFERFLLLAINDSDYLLRIKSDDTFLYFIIYYFENNSKTIFAISHENEEFSTKSKNCNVISESRLDSQFDFNNAIKFDLSSLRKCFDKNVRTIIKISSPSFEIANNKLLKFMECPVCSEYMTQQIRQCSQGHSLCKVCRNKLQECPLCKSGFGASRNYALESLSSIIYFPCRNVGCTQYISGDIMEKHELDCDFKTYQCPFLIKLNCKWKGLHDNITEHLLMEHSEYTELSNYVQRKISLDYSNHKYDTICIVLGENIFKVCVCINGANKLFLTYGLYGPASVANKFYWETGIFHKNSDRHKFVVKDVCPNYTTTNYKMDIEGYGVDDTIYFYHKVTSNVSIYI